MTTLINLITPHDTIKDALKKLDNAATRLLIIADINHKLLGKRLNIKLLLSQIKKSGSIKTVMINVRFIQN